MTEPVPLTELSAFKTRMRHRRIGRGLGTSWPVPRWIGSRRFDLTVARMSRPCWGSGSKELCTSVPDRRSGRRRTSRKTLIAC